MHTARGSPVNSDKAGVIWRHPEYVAEQFYAQNFSPTSSSYVSIKKFEILRWFLLPSRLVFPAHAWLFIHVSAWFKVLFRCSCKQSWVPHSLPCICRN